MVESAGIKAQDLMQKSPASKASTDTSQILTKYHSLKDLAMVSTILCFIPCLLSPAKVKEVCLMKLI